MAEDEDAVMEPLAVVQAEEALSRRPGEVTVAEAVVIVAAVVDTVAAATVAEEIVAVGIAEAEIAAGIVEVAIGAEVAVTEAAAAADDPLRKSTRLLPEESPLPMPR